MMVARERKLRATDLNRKAGYWVSAQTCLGRRGMVVLHEDRECLVMNAGAEFPAPITLRQARAVAKKGLARWCKRCGQRK